MRYAKPEFDEELVLEIEDYLDQVPQTEIVARSQMAETGLYATYSAVSEGTRISRGRVYMRPMFQIMNDNTLFNRATSHVHEPCVACMDFSRSWACEEHQAEAAEREKPTEPAAQDNRLGGARLQGIVGATQCNCGLCEGIRSELQRHPDNPMLRMYQGVLSQQNFTWQPTGTSVTITGQEGVTITYEVGG